MYKGTSTYHINSCETIEVFYNLRCDLDKLETAMKLNKMVQDVTTENQNCFTILQLYLNTLYTISETEADLNLVTNIFKLRLSSLIGFTPRIGECVNCASKENLKYFSIKDSGFKCLSCGKQDKSAISVNEGAKKAIEYTILAPPKKLYSFNVKDEALKEFNLVSKVYYKEHIEGV